LITAAATNGAQTAPGAAATTTDKSAQALPPDDASTQIAQLLQQTAAPAEKPVVDAAAAKAPATPIVQVAADTKKAATQSATAAPRGAPTTRNLEPATTEATTADAPKAAEATQTAQPSIIPLPTNPAPQADVQQIAQQTNSPQQPAAPATQLDFSNAAPITTATAIAAAATPRTTLRDVAKDDSLDPIDATSPTGATATFALPEHHDIATVDGKVPVPAPSSPQFGDALGAKLSWMAERHIGHAEIRLSPDDLGTIDVRVRLNGEHVRAEFNSANADVRQAINNHLPRLRDMLSQQGFNLAESHVGNGSNQQSGKNASSDPASASVEDEIALPAPRIPAYTHNGILNTFA
jgi:flagellar hook-length control protein FliK